MSFLGDVFKAMFGSKVAVSATCPICGAKSVKSEMKKPLGSFVKDGPTVMEMKCRKCGHKWSFPVRVGP
jgi:DNA-directed RNA polymerase subunit M/transcription elongation factor TFIIS